MFGLGGQEILLLAGCAMVPFVIVVVVLLAIRANSRQPPRDRPPEDERDEDLS